MDVKVFKVISGDIPKDTVLKYMLGRYSLSFKTPGQRSVFKQTLIELKNNIKEFESVRGELAEPFEKAVRVELKSGEKFVAHLDSFTFAKLSSIYEEQKENATSI